MKPTAFELSPEEKTQRIAELFAQIMDTLGLDLADDSLRQTPERVARMYVNELFRGLDPANCPAATTFENRYDYGQLLVERNIAFHSQCEHHFLPMIGRAHVGYISAGRVIGLSKINRIVDYYARRPQVQERVTRQVLHHLQNELGTEDVAVVIEAQHLCVSTRGVAHPESNTVTMEFGGAFHTPDSQRLFLTSIGR
jgi:GTP cyclohydrolase I